MEWLDVRQTGEAPIGALEKSKLKKDVPLRGRGALPGGETANGRGFHNAWRLGKHRRTTGVVSFAPQPING